MNFPLVSIVTPSYNQANFLEETILSVLKQDYPNIQYIIIDGGSTDGSLEIISKYEHKLSYWISEKDRGQSHAINKGWELAEGEIWCYLNSDDVFFDKKAISKVIEAFNRQNQAAMVYGNCEIIDENSDTKGIIKGRPATLIDLVRDNFGEYMAQPSCFFNAKYIDAVGLINEKYHYSMDFEFIARLGKIGTFLYINETLAKYRVHKNAKSLAFAQKQLIESLKIRWKYNKKYFFKHLINLLKISFYFVLPKYLQKKLKPEFYKKYNE